MMISRLAGVFFFLKKGISVYQPLVSTDADDLQGHARKPKAKTKKRRPKMPSGEVPGIKANPP
jgi:hypothetical protein